MAVRTFNGNLYFLFSATGLDWMRDGDHVLPRGVPRHVRVMRVLSASVNGGAYLPRFDQDHSREYLLRIELTVVAEPDGPDPDPRCVARFPQ